MYDGWNLNQAYWAILTFGKNQFYFLCWQSKEKDHIIISTNDGIVFDKIICIPYTNKTSKEYK